MSTSSSNLNTSDVSFSYSTLEEIGVEEEDEKEPETIFNNPYKFYIRYAAEKHEYYNIYKESKLKYYSKIIYSVIHLIITEKTVPLLTDTFLRIPLITIGLPVLEKVGFTIGRLLKIPFFTSNNNISKNKYLLLYKCK